MRKFILASASPRRKELLAQLGIAFQVCVSNKEEVCTKTKPEDVVKELSQSKAAEVFAMSQKEAIVIGADTVVAFENRILGKPKNEQDAFAMIQLLQGKVHKVYTGVTILWRQEAKQCQRTFVSETEVEFCAMCTEEIQEYISSKDMFIDPNTQKPEWMDKAGAYGIQGQFGARYVKKITGDYYNVVGLPASSLYEVLKQEQLLS